MARPVRGGTGTGRAAVAVLVLFVSAARRRFRSRSERTTRIKTGQSRGTSGRFGDWRWGRFGGGFGFKLVAENHDIGRRFDAQANFIAGNPDNGQNDGIAEANSFGFFTGKDEHGETLYVGS